jgi:hypothetical protein
MVWVASSHVLRPTLSGTPKILLYCTEYNRPTTLPPLLPPLGEGKHRPFPVPPPTPWNFRAGCPPLPARFLALSGKGRREKAIQFCSTPPFTIRNGFFLFDSVLPRNGRAGWRLIVVSSCDFFICQFPSSLLEVFCQLLHGDALFWQ